MGIFWCLYHNAWLTILAYHAQILWWSRDSHPKLLKSAWTPLMFVGLAAVLAGPLLYMLLPHVTRTDLPTWLAENRLSGVSLGLMVFYFGLVHPLLEQIHWTPLRQRTPAAHPAFAGYHLLVLFSLLTIPWLIVCLAVLFAASVMWQRQVRDSGSLAPAIVSHAAADLGIVIAAWLRA